MAFEVEVPYHVAPPQGCSGHGRQLPQKKGSKREGERAGRETERQIERQRDKETERWRKKGGGRLGAGDSQGCEFQEVEPLGIMEAGCHDLRFVPKDNVWEHRWGCLCHPPGHGQVTAIN